MNVAPILTGVITGIGLLLLFITVTTKERNLLQERLADDDGKDDIAIGEEWAGMSLTDRLFKPIAHGFVALVGKVIPVAQLRAVDQQLSDLDNPWGLDGRSFISLLIATGTGGLMFGILITLAAQLAPPLSIMTPFVFGMAGVLYPRIKVQRLAKTRQKDIAQSLPDMLDLLCICVEAGLAIDAGIREVAFAYDNALAMEFRRLINELNLGRSRDDALAAMAKRSGVEELSSLTNAIIQSQKLGSGIGPTLRVQSEEIRRIRRQKAEESAAKAPLKMLFPMVGCIFPAIFVVLLGPAIVEIATGGPKG